MANRQAEGLANDSVEPEWEITPIHMDSPWRPRDFIAFLALVLLVLVVITVAMVGGAT